MPAIHFVQSPGTPARPARPARRPARDDPGQAMPLLIGVIAIAAASLVPIARLGRAASDAARARAAADAAALSGVIDGTAAARRIAGDNGAVLVSFTRVGADVIVTVRVGEAVARARATPNGDATSATP